MALSASLCYFRSRYSSIYIVLIPFLPFCFHFIVFLCCSNVMFRELIISRKSNMLMELLMGSSFLRMSELLLSLLANIFQIYQICENKNKFNDENYLPSFIRGIVQSRIGLLLLRRYEWTSRPGGSMYLYVSPLCSK